jgi:hypothetical protein
MVGELLLRPALGLAVLADVLPNAAPDIHGAQAILTGPIDLQTMSLILLRLNRFQGGDDHGAS